MFLIDFDAVDEEKVYSFFDTSRAYNWRLNNGLKFYGYNKSHISYKSTLDPCIPHKVELVFKVTKPSIKANTFLAIIAGDKVIISFEYKDGSIFVKKVEVDACGHAMSRSSPVALLDLDVLCYLQIQFHNDENGFHVYVWVHNQLVYSETYSPLIYLEEDDENREAFRLVLGKMQSGKAKLSFHIFKLTSQIDDLFKDIEFSNLPQPSAASDTHEVSRFIYDSNYYSIIRNPGSNVGYNWLILDGEIFRISRK